MPRVNVKDRRRQQLIDANIASIARRGYAETTITHIAEGAGLSRGIVNFYFTTKEAMMLDTLRCLVEDYTAHWQAALKEKTESSAEERLQTLIDANFDKAVCSTKRLTVWSAFWGHSTSHKDYGKIIQTGDELHIACIAELWEKIVEEKGTRKRAQSTFPQQLHSMIRGAWLMLLVSPNLYDAKTLLQVCQRALGEAVALLGDPVATTDRNTKEKDKKVVQLSSVRPKKKKEPLPASERQLDFADLFGS